MTRLIKLIILIIIQNNILFAALSEPKNKSFIGASAPEWVIPLEIPQEPIPAKPSQVNFQILLIDQQFHTEKNTSYMHKAFKILTQTGAEQNTQLRFDYHPLNQTFHMHSLRIFRDGSWFDRMDTTKHKLIQQEDDLSTNIYRGTLSSIYFLNDIRPGDIVEYSCSWKNSNSFFCAPFSMNLYLQEYTCVEKIFHRIVTSPSKPLAYHSFYETKAPQIEDLPEGMQEWIWEATNTTAVPREENKPNWFNPYARVHVTQYKNWKEVALKLRSLYEFSLDSPHEEIEKLTTLWKAATIDPLERAALALQFVQDEIRYLGMQDESDGMGGIKPAHPYVVFERRFGDCKEKTVLLQTLLHHMNISSHPVLVHSSYGSLLEETVPSPWIFNHAILQITIDDKNYFVDPTYSLQGGSLEHRYCPDYGWGLQISSTSEGLIPFPKQALNKSVNIEVSVKINENENADIAIEITKYGNQADKIRRYLEYTGLPKISKTSTTILKKIYGAAEVITPLTFQDDREKNEFTTRETYRVPLRNRGGEISLKIQSQTLSCYLTEELNLDRTSPHALRYPLWVEEHISCKLARSKNKHESKNISLTNNSVSYRYIYEEKDGDIDIRYQLKNLKDHVPAESIKEYWNILDEIQSEHIEEIKIRPLG